MPVDVRLKRLFRHSHLRKNSFGPIAFGARPTGAVSPMKIFAFLFTARILGIAASTRLR